VFIRKVFFLLVTIIMVGSTVWLVQRYFMPVDLAEIEVPDRLHPTVAQKRDELIRLANQKGISLIITEGFRTLEEQNRLYEQGRSLPGQVVTNARGGESLHNFGLAIDFALLDTKGKASWDMTYDGNDNSLADWMEVVNLAKELGFQWGGDWQGFKDYPHLQMDFGYSLRELQRGKWPTE
jgi:peptidoglycan LD-endopeptidase CwlK